MASEIEFGRTKRGKETLLVNNFEYWFEKQNGQGEKLWRCCKRQSFHCKAFIRTRGTSVVDKRCPEHTHQGNVAASLARKAVADMKVKMTETIATPSSSQAAVIVQIGPQVQMALPKRASVSRVLRRHRQIKMQIGGTRSTLPPPPTDRTFEMPERFQPFVLFDSGPGADRLLIFGDRGVMESLGRAKLWLADGTFTVVPSIFFQLYTIHFEYTGGFNPVGLYCLLANKTYETYARLIAEVKMLLPTSAPSLILVDFENAAMRAFAEGFPSATISGCYYHLCQSVIRKVSDLGLKQEYASNDEVRGFVRCLPALAHVPPQDVVEAFDILTENMPHVDNVSQIATYFEHTYIRGRRLRGRVENYGPALFPVPLWNKFEAAGEGIARTTNIVEGWHCGLQSLLMCAHPTMWVFLDGVEKDCAKNKATMLQAAAGATQVSKKPYRELRARVANAVAGYGQSNTLTYLRAIAHLSHQ
jgi:FLYWCH zinc finger domain/MULE transposase domain